MSVSSREKSASWKVNSRQAVQEVPGVCTNYVSIPCLLEICRVVNAVFAHALSSRQHLIKGGSSVFVGFIPLRYMIIIFTKLRILMPGDDLHDQNMKHILAK